MYGNGVTAAGTLGGAGALAYTGINTAWMILAALMLVMAGVTLIKLTPKFGKNHE